MSEQKKLLILGGTSASLDLVRKAKELGAYTVVVDDRDTGVAKEIADKSAKISTIDIDALAAFVKQEKIDGAFCGPSEFNLRNLFKLCEKTGLPCYTTTEGWNRCANKDEFTACCRKYGVDVPEEYDIHENMTDREYEKIDFPIILKPVDGCSSIGISVCRNRDEVPAAYKKAMDASTCKRIIAEKYIENGGELFGVRYLVQDGKAYPYLTIDTYVADPVHRTSLISNYTFTPSKYLGYYMEHMDANVRKMIKGMGIENGTVFFQSLPYKGKIYFHEMGYRLSGGMIYKLTEPLMGIDDMKLMLRFALGGACVTDEEINKIDLNCHGKVGAQLMMPLNVGTIARIDGLEEAKHEKTVTDFLQYYSVNDTIEPRFIGTLQQHFGRFTMISDSKEEIESDIRRILDELVIYDINGSRMNTLLFDLSRVEKSQIDQ